PPRAPRRSRTSGAPCGTEIRPPRERSSPPAPQPTGRRRRLTLANVSSSLCSTRCESANAICRFDLEFPQGQQYALAAHIALTLSAQDQPQEFPHERRQRFAGLSVDVAVGQPAQGIFGERHVGIRGGYNVRTLTHCEDLH